MSAPLSAAYLSGTPALEITDLHAWHGDVHALRGVNLHIPRGQVTALLGPNGSGRSTVLRSIMGLVQARSGSVRIHGTESIHLPLDKILHLGIGYRSANPDIHPDLSCEENLLLPTSLHDTLGGGLSLAEIYELFPLLYQCRDLACTRLSEGEQQLLAIARILRSGANLILLDEVTQGLAPVVAHGLARVLGELKQQGYTVLLIEPGLRPPATLADHFYVMEQGRIVDEFSLDELPLKQASLATTYPAG